jgi:hypothetical protein
MLIQIGENSASLTSFGSLASADHSAVGDRPSAIRLAFRWIRNLFPAAWVAVKPH